jgi:large subunit ribosomal protein L29
MSKARVELEKIRDLPDDELVQALDRARDELFRLQLGNYTNQVENTMSVRGKRRELARILTVIGNRACGAETQTERGREQAAASAGAEEPAATPRKTKKKKED